MTTSGPLVHQTVPARAGDPPHPALVLLHGRGADEHDLLGLTSLLDPRFLVVSVRAPYPWMVGFCWYELDGPGRAEETTFKHSLSLLLEFVDAVPAAQAIDPARLYLLGFSQGAMMSNALLLTAPHQVAGGVLLSGFQPAVEQLSIDHEGVRGKPALVVHGARDDILPVELGRSVRDTLTSLGLDVRYLEYPIGHEIVMPELDEIQAWLSSRLAGEV